MIRSRAAGALHIAKASRPHEGENDKSSALKKGNDALLISGRRRATCNRIHPLGFRAFLQFLAWVMIAVMPAPGASQDNAAAIRVPLKQIAGRPCVRATVNGRPLWLVLDTGSAVSVLEASTAKECGLDLHSGGARATGMLGTESLLRTATYPVQIGPLTFPARPWFIRQNEARKSADRSLLQPTVQFNLLGMDRLATTCRFLTLDGRKGEVVFGTERFHAEPGAAFAAAPLEMRRGVPYVELDAGTARFSCLVDTGSSVPLLLDPATAAGLKERTFRVAGGRPLGLGDQPSARTHAWSTTLPEIRLGTGVLTKVKTLVLQHPPALGYDAFADVTVTFDFEARRVWMRK